MVNERINITDVFDNEELILFILTYQKQHNHTSWQNAISDLLFDEVANWEPEK